MNPYSIHHVVPTCTVCGSRCETVDHIQDGAAIEVCVPCGNRIGNGADALRWVETEGRVVDEGMPRRRVTPAGGHWEHSSGGGEWRRIGTLQAQREREERAKRKGYIDLSGYRGRGRAVVLGGTEYPSITAASRETGISRPAIRAALTNGGTVKGMRAEYAR